MKQAAIAFVSLLIMGCGLSDATTFTLYRNSVLNANARLHVATFNADQETDYNAQNCQIAAELFQSQPMVKTKFWCEKGKFRP